MLGVKILQRTSFENYFVPILFKDRGGGGCGVGNGLRLGGGRLLLDRSEGERA